MALTFTVTNLKGFSIGNKRGRTATVVTSGTTTDNGDTFAPSLLGLSNIDSLEFNGTGTISATDNPETGFPARWVRATGKVVFFTNTAAATNTPANVITDGETVAQTMEVTAIGI